MVSIAKKMFLIVFLSALGIFSLGCSDSSTSIDLEDEMMKKDIMNRDRDLGMVGPEYEAINNRYPGAFSSTADDGSSFKCDNGLFFELTGENEALGYVCELKIKDANGNQKGYWNAKNEKDFCERKFEEWKASNGVNCTPM